MRSRVYEGTLAHARLGAERHRFQFPALGYVLDLDELSELERRLPWFGYNHVRPVALHDRDHLDAGPGSIRDKLLRLLATHDCADGVKRLELITHPRWFHAVFNPVSFHLAWRADGSLRAVVAEVNNTFGERHCYLLSGPTLGWDRPVTASKVFHVSPFCAIEGQYRFRFQLNGGAGPARTYTMARVDHEDASGPLLQTCISGKLEPLTRASARRAFFSMPLMTFFVIARIHWHALRLALKRVPFHRQPTAPERFVTR